MTKEIILNFLKIHKNELRKKYGLEKIGLFGSYARGTENENSDIDLAIVTEKKDFFIRDDLKDFLEENFKLPVDIGYLDSFRDFYKSKIEKEIIYV
jgi:predicted nucleotidyltransferase